MDVNVLNKISYGMYVVSSNKGDLLNGQIANTVFQITNEPITMAVSINKQNLTHEYIESSNYLGISILSEEAPIQFIGKFGFRSGRNEDKFKDTKFIKLPNGCPVITDYSLGYIDGKVINKFSCGTHTLFLVEILGAEMLKDGNSMTYDFYHKVKKGTTPKSAPTFVKPIKKEAIMDKYKCVVCNYIYDPVQGDPDNGVPAGTPFEKIPDDWVCPVCGADKTNFVKE